MSINARAAIIRRLAQVSCAIHSRVAYYPTLIQLQCKYLTTHSVKNEQFVKIKNVHNDKM